MSPVQEREEAMRMLLAEVAPGVGFNFAAAPVGYSMWVDYCDAGIKAGRLSALRVHGPDFPTICDRHLQTYNRCDLIPVSWTLLGHTCGREA